VRWPERACGAIAPFLTFLLNFFASRQKVEKNNEYAKRKQTLILNYEENPIRPLSFYYSPLICRHS
jgi:hypothetical protein